MISDKPTPRSFGIECIACGNTITTPPIVHRGIPSFLFPMPLHLAEEVEFRDIIIQTCDHCGHAFQRQIDEELIERIYTRYYAHYPADLEAVQRLHYRAPFESYYRWTLGNVDTNRRNLLEIGCSTPQAMSSFAELGYSCTGVDPSPLLNAEACDGVEIVGGFYEEIDLKKEYDVIISRFNLEHIVHIDRHLEKMKEDLAPQGIVVVQVPNVSLMIENRQPNYVAYEHIQYFQPQSLTALFRRHGFEPVLPVDGSGASILGAFQKTERQLEQLPPISNSWGSYYRSIQGMSTQLEEVMKESIPTICYGCGMTLFWVLSLAGQKALQSIMIVDDNEQMHGKYIPAYRLRVGPPDATALKEAKRIILTVNPIYHATVIERLRETGTNAKIYAIDNNGVTLTKLRSC